MNTITTLLTIASLIALSQAACQMMRRGGLTCQEKEEIVNMHNALRQRVATGQVRGQPSASNMLQMVWDEELAAKAQSWADQCPQSHDSNFARRVSRFAVGQNIATTWSSALNAYGQNPDFTSQINAWFNEVYSYSFNGQHSGANHYSQMVWSDSFLVGCGYAFYYDDGKYVKKYICDYGPAGNVAGSSPYRAGSPVCSTYGSTPSRRFSGLCEMMRYSSNPCSRYGKK